MKDKEPYRWVCPVKGCNTSGRAKTKADARTALLLHLALIHGKS